ncbi:hypothetical protein [Demequina zhanjiangensis]|uniref:Uncharacterized protein n=1 Tax=Demequina zhanjiangensis TaxID=3051659 RepID=A0ABT8FY23_9MICO|nr:hypothetical protein [Demequina sp. SYSU T00b26]MDN4471808.1 hypothetical protein [Demequina sp. SYSU T00b26]
MGIINLEQRPVGYPSFRVDIGAVATSVVVSAAAAALALGAGAAIISVSGGDSPVAPVCDNASRTAEVTFC